jgi:TRAP-type mannitol/chloroaromatic compound transport system substrate-binding protein
MAQTPLYFYIGKEPALAYATGAPFGMNHRHQHSWWSFGGGAELCNEALKPFKTHAILCGNSGTQMGGWFRKEIKTVEDLQGLKFRIAGMGGHVLAKLGIVPQQIAGGEVYSALEKGSIDAAEFVGPYDDEKLGFYKVAKYYYFPGWWEGGAMLHMIVNEEKWNALPKQYQAVLNQAGSAAGAWMIEKYDSVNPAALKRLVAGGAELRAFPQPVMEACYKATQDHLNEIAEKSALFKKTKESHDAYMKEVLFYTQIAEKLLRQLSAQQNAQGLSARHRCPIAGGHREQYAARFGGRHIRSGGGMCRDVDLDCRAGGLQDDAVWRTRAGRQSKASLSRHSSEVAIFFARRNRARERLHRAEELSVV